MSTFREVQTLQLHLPGVLVVERAQLHHGWYATTDVVSLVPVPPLPSYAKPRTRCSPLDVVGRGEMGALEEMKVKATAKIVYINGAD